jgi:hypothetical protein
MRELQAMQWMGRRRRFCCRVMVPVGDGPSRPPPHGHEAAILVKRKLRDYGQEEAGCRRFPKERPHPVPGSTGRRGTWQETHSLRIVCRLFPRQLALTLCTPSRFRSEEFPRCAVVFRPPDLTGTGPTHEQYGTVSKGKGSIASSRSPVRIGGHPRPRFPVVRGTPNIIQVFAINKRAPRKFREYTSCNNTCDPCFQPIKATEDIDYSARDFDSCRILPRMYEYPVGW